MENLDHVFVAVMIFLAGAFFGCIMLFVMETISDAVQEHREKKEMRRFTEWLQNRNFNHFEVSRKDKKEEGEDEEE